MRKTTEHIRACRSCAVELSRLEEQLATIVEADETLGRSLPEPPKVWLRLESRLQAARVKSPPFWKNPLPSLKSAFRMPLTYGSAALSLLLIALLIWWPVAPVSAKEVIERSTAADTERFKITPQEIVCQRVQVTKTRALAFREETARLESWKSTRSTYWQSGGDPVNLELLNRYKVNGLASALPLSPLALESWLKLAGSELNASRHGERIEVQTASKADGQAQGLQQVSFHVLAKNWHVYQMTLSFQDVIFQITEEQSSILDRSEVPNDVLAHLEPEPRQPNGIVRAKPALSASRNVTPAVNLDDLEVAVRYDLHSLGADLGENIAISKGASNRLVVNAAGASPPIKEHLAAMLGNQSAVDLELSAPPGQMGTRRPATTVVPQTTVPQQDERLLNFFGGFDAEENYARTVLQTNTSLLAHLYALQDLAKRWPADQDNDLSAAARAQLSAILKDHARAVQAGVSQLDTELDPLLKNFGQPPKRDQAPLDRTGWQGASLSALDAARSADRILRSLLTISDSPISLDDGLPKLKQSVQEMDRAGRELSTARE